MKYISHRGNIIGPDILRENKMDSIKSCIDEYGLDVEIDIYVNDNVIYLNHDDTSLGKLDREGVNLIEKYNKNLWIHCKNIDALIFMNCHYADFNYFGHSNDEFVLTSKKFIFTKPCHLKGINVINVMPELVENISFDTIYSCYGVLTDYPLIYEKNYTTIRT